MRTWIGLAMVLALCCFPKMASGYITPPVVWQPPAFAGEEFLVEVGYGLCDGLQVFNVQDREIQRNGSVIRITVRAYWTDDFAACIFPPGAVHVVVGPLPAGQYRVELFRRHIEVPTIVIPGPVSDIVVVERQGTGPQSIPTLSSVGLGFLFGLLALFGLMAAVKTIPD